MSAFRNNILTADEGDLFGFGAIIGTDGVVTGISGPTFRRVTAAPSGSVNRGSLAIRSDAGNVGLFIATDAVGTWAAIPVFGSVIPAGAQLLIADNVNPSYQIGSAGDLDMVVYDTTEGAERVIVNAAAGFRVTAGGITVVAGGVTLTAGNLTITAGGLIFSANGSQVTIPDNVNPSMQIGSTGALNMLVFDTSDGAERLISNATNGIRVVVGGITVVAGGVTVTAGGLTVTAGGLNVVAGSVAFPAASLNIDQATEAVADGQVGAGLVVGKTYSAGAANTDFALPARTGGWRIIEVWIRSNGATGGNLKVQTAGSAADVTDAMVPGNNNVITRCAQILNANATFAGGATVRLNAAGGTPAGEAFLMLQPL